MTEEFYQSNPSTVGDQFSINVDGVNVKYAAPIEYKRLIPQAIGLIRTGDMVQYENLILVSG